jgi:hypothetical protein
MPSLTPYPDVAPVDPEFRAIRCQGSFGVMGLDESQSAIVYGDAVYND